MSRNPYMPGVLAWRTRSGADGRLEYTQRYSLPVRLVLLLFLPHCGMAVGMLGVGLAGVFIKPFGLLEGLPYAMIPVLLLFGVIFTPLTFIMQFLRTSVLLDRPRGELVDTTGLKFLPYIPLLPIKKRGRLPMKDVLRVLLEAQTGKRSFNGYRVALQVRGERDILVADCHGLREGRALAEEVAAFAGVAMKDATGTVARQRSPEELDQPLILRPDSAPPAAEAPPSLVSEVSEDAGRLVALRRQRPYRIGRWIAALLMGVALLVIGTRFSHEAPFRPYIPVRAEFSPKDPPPPSLWPWRFGMVLYGLVEAARVAGLVATALSALIIVVLLLLQSPGRRLEASRESLRLTSSYLGVRWTRRIPVSELEELRVDGSDQKGWQLRAISDARILQYGDGLPRAELDHLCARVWKSIQAP